ncbi:hypothetical protein ACFS5J_11340 [Flavobacterium chuncheonense]|uniref:GAF domain-containing protein n=1 Tax=Flavobacterium chuncheonense TaxID=2026653 RepID=A0ABW5YNQ7_9FLAO
MGNQNTELFKVVISLRLLKEKLENELNSSNILIKQQAELVLKLFEESPDLASGTSSLEDFYKHKSVIDQIMATVFPSALTDNEIKAAVSPYSNDIFYCSNRLQRIINDSEIQKDIFKNLYQDNENSIDLLAYTIILNSYYNYAIDFDRPKTITVTNLNGVRKRYRVTFNADFLDIYPNENAIEITKDIVNELLANANDKTFWKKYFPDNSWTVEGFGIINLIDTTLDEQIDDFKTHLIEPNRESFKLLKEDIRRIFNLPNLQLGSYSMSKDFLFPAYDKNFEIITLSQDEQLNISQYACDQVNKQLFVDFKPVIIANVEQYHKQTNGNRLSNLLLKKGLKSIVLIPILINKEVNYIIELASDCVNQINAINMVKLDTIMPFILSYSARVITEFQNEIRAVIQEECTSIHHAVVWRFEEEASKYIQARNNDETPTFNEIVFKDVLPLYGQVDIVGSSIARNDAIQKDLTSQLEQTKSILQKRLTNGAFSFYEQLIYQIDKLLYELKDAFLTNSEQEVNLFYEKQIFPLLEHLAASNSNNQDIKVFLESLEKESKTIYKARKAYDCTVDATNKTLSSFLDKQQIVAQNIYPHYFEKFKTDGIEHNIYLGQSIAKNATYHPSTLYSLRLWQLQVTCEMEAMYYQKQKEFPVQLEVASLILAYDVPITIRYRMDEKRFDVDGAYNVRYEMIKKRIDKAHIKNTNERLTQPHKLCVVYSSNAIEREYLKYFEFLQSKNYVGKEIEILELEELQGATGIKAIRVDLNHNLKKVAKTFTIEDLQNT